jgi:hypothetical protein
LHGHALYFLWTDFHPCLYVYIQVFLLFFPWVLEERAEPKKKKFCLIFCQSILESPKLGDYVHRSYALSVTVHSIVFMFTFDP